MQWLGLWWWVVVQWFQSLLQCTWGGRDHLVVWMFALLQPPPPSAAESAALLLSAFLLASHAEHVTSCITTECNYSDSQATTACSDVTTVTLICVSPKCKTKYFIGWFTSHQANSVSLWVVSAWVLCKLLTGVTYNSALSLWFLHEFNSQKSHIAVLLNSVRVLWCIGWPITRSG